jgi:protein-L-isoaspartate(D-aspartate) O-methyltransferase
MDNTNIKKYLQRQIKLVTGNRTLREHLYQQKEELLMDLIRRGIRSQKIITAIEQVPREEFVPERFNNYAYENMDLPIGCEQTISSPYIIAYKLQEANINGQSKVLEIGAGSGYQTALLSLLCDKVYSIEIIPKLAISAEELLRNIGYYSNDNIEIEIGNGYLTGHEKNYFDAIIVNAAAIVIPNHLKEILKVNGRLLIPVEDKSYKQKLFKITKDAEENFTEEILCDVQFAPMVR